MPGGAGEKEGREMITDMQLIGVLGGGPLSISDLHVETGAPMPELSRQLKHLREIGEVEFSGGKYSLSELQPAGKSQDKPQEEKSLPDDIKKIFDLLKNAKHRLSGQTFVDHLGYTGRRRDVIKALRARLQKYVESGELSVDDSHYYWLTAYPKEHPTTLRMKQGRHPTFGIPKTVAPPKTDLDSNAALAAIDQLAEKMRPKPVENCALKTAVLRKLAPIVDLSIGAVLSEIANDLEGRHELD